MKVDITEVNKKSSQSSRKVENRHKETLQAKLEKFLKKQKGPARDNAGKFTSGSGGLRIAKKLNNKRAFSLIVVVSLVGGLFVFRSFAGSANGSFVTEMYQRCYNTMKSSGSDYDFWKKKLDGGTDRNTVWAQFVAATGKACSYPYPPATSTVASSSSSRPAASSAPTTQSSSSTTQAPTTSRPTGTSMASMTAAQVKALYQKVLGRDPSQSEVDYWVEKSKTWTSAQIEAHIKQSNEGFRTNIAAKLTEAQAWKTLADAHVSNAKTYNDQTYKLSTQTVVSKENLDTISQRVGAVRSALSQVQGGLSTVNDSSQKAAAISAPETSQFQGIASSLASSIQQLNGYLKNIENDYARANKTYEANLGFFNQLADTQRQQANCRAQGGTPTWSGGCDRPPAAPQPINQGSGGSAGGSVSRGDTPCARAPQSNITACQKYLGVVADGIWGPKTEAAFQAKFGYGSGWQAGGGSTNGSASGSSRPTEVCPRGYTQTGRYPDGKPICKPNSQTVVPPTRGETDPRDSINVVNLPAVPYPMCAKKTAKCVRNYKQLPSGVITNIEVCDRRMYGLTALGLATPNDTTVNG